MATNSTPSSAKLPPKSFFENTQNDEMPETNIDDRRPPPVNMGGSRKSGSGVTDADPKTGRADATDHIPAPQTANRE